jgi:hypothetical protein
MCVCVCVCVCRICAYIHFYIYTHIHTADLKNVTKVTDLNEICIYAIYLFLHHKPFLRNLITLSASLMKSSGYSGAIRCKIILLM